MHQNLRKYLITMYNIHAEKRHLIQRLEILQKHTWCHYIFIFPNVTLKLILAYRFLANM